MKNFRMVRLTGRGLVDNILSTILVLSILIALAALVYVVITPEVKPGDTDFYILGSRGKAEDYVTEIITTKDEITRREMIHPLGEEAEVILGIVNREQATVSYRVEIRMNEEKQSEIGPLVLGHDKTLENVVTFTPDRLGDQQLVEFLLYKNGQNKVYRSLHLWFNVRE